ncbi:MAG: S-layer homology domain-containing protein [Candidatus Gracilibacteria bacterium]|nr:S-layer homology domain-containing protein [Candidatus Gracilibacteria bacterium]
MPVKTKTSLLRLAMLLGSTIASLFLVVAFSPGAAAVDITEVDVTLGDSDIDPATSPANNVVQKLTYTATLDSTVTAMTIVNTGDSLIDAEIASLRICVDGDNDGDNTSDNGTYDVATDACVYTKATPTGITTGTGPHAATLDSAMVIDAGKSATVFIIIDFATSGVVVDAHTIQLTTNATDGTGDTFAGAAVQATGTKTVTVVATKLKVTGTASQVAGANNELTVAARDSNNNLDLDYAGAKPLVFSGLAASPDGTASTIEAIAIGSTTSTTFTAGVTNGSSLTLVAKKTGVTAIDVTDSTLSSTGAAADALDLTVTVGAATKLMISQQASTNPAVNNLFNPQPVVNITDAYGNTRTADTDTITAAPFLAADCTSAAAGTLSGDTKAATAGVATFTALQHDTIETIYLKYTTGALTAACSGVAGTLLSSASASSVAVARGAQHNDTTSTTTTTTTTTTTPATTSTTTTTTPTTTTPATTETATTATTTNRYTTAGVSESEVDTTVSAFSDLQKDSWNAPFIARMKKQNILSGYADGSVKPDNTINRAELAKIASLAFNLTSSKAVGLSDIPEAAWFNSFIGALQAAGASYTTGVTYDPAAGVSRAEALWVLLKAAGIDVGGTPTEKLFPDVNRNHKYAAAITYAAQHGIVSGYDNGNFGPTDTLTRAQVAKIVTLILEQL